jgi:hypothetical protein
VNCVGLFEVQTGFLKCYLDELRLQRVNVLSMNEDTKTGGQINMTSFSVLEAWVRLTTSLSWRQMTICTHFFTRHVIDDLSRSSVYPEWCNCNTIDDTSASVQFRARSAVALFRSAKPTSWFLDYKRSIPKHGLQFQHCVSWESNFFLLVLHDWMDHHEVELFLKSL